MKQKTKSNIDTTRCNLYLPSGFPDMVDIIDKSNEFCAVIAARGVGKTVSGVGALDTIAKRDSLEFPYCFFMRRTAAIMDELMNPLLNPFNKANQCVGTALFPDKLGKSSYAIYDLPQYDGKQSPSVAASGATPAMIGAPLSTIANIRGFSTPSIKFILYDEAVPEKSQRNTIKDEGDALDNAYETINRNNKLEGLPEVKFIALANNNNIFKSEIAYRWGLIEAINYMETNNVEQYHDDDACLSVIFLKRSPISEAKKDTALYKRNRRLNHNGSESFTDMAISNTSRFDASNIRQCVLTEYRPLLRVGELYIYKHKSRDEYFATFKKTGTFKYEYEFTPKDTIAILDRFAYLRYCYISNKSVFFESAIANVVFEKIFDIK